MTAATLYDQTWDQWVDMKNYGPTSQHQRRLIHNLLRPLAFETVLDTGCGAGNLLLEIQLEYPHVKKLAGLEISQAALDISQQRLPQGEFTLLDLQTGHLAQKYDLTLSVDVLEHILDDESALRNIHAMTDKYFLAVTIQGEYLPQWEVDQVGHVRNYKRGELVSKMKAAGFSILQVIEWGFPFYSPLYRGFQGFTKAAGTTGTYGITRKMIAKAIYALFWLNSAQRGDVIMVLGEPNHPYRG